MPNLFGVDIAKEIASAMGASLLPLTLIKITVTTPDTSYYAEGGETETSYSGRGILDSYEEKQIDGTIVQTGDRKVLILGGTLTSGIIPEPNDKVTIEGSTFRIINVMRDPAAATYTCQVRV